MVQLGTYEDAAPVSSGSVNTELMQDPHKGFNMEGFNLNNALAREYIVSSLTWSSASASGALLGTLNFPDLIFAQPFIAAKIKDFRFFKGGVRLSIRVTANKFLYGKLLICYNPDPTTDIVGTLDVVKASGLPHMLVSASATEVAIFDVPFISKYRALDISNYRVAEIGRFSVYVLNPLTSVTTDIDNGKVVITAQFLEPELFLPHDVTPDTVAARALRVDGVVLESGRGNPHAKEAAAKAKNASIASVHEATAPMRSAVSNTRREVGRAFSRVAEGVATTMASAFLMGLSKPTSLDYSQVVTVNPYKTIAGGKGIDTTVKIAMDPENAISTLPNVGGITEDEMQLTYVAGVPSLCNIVTFLPTSTPFEIASLGAFDPHTTNVDTLSQMFHFHSGSYKFKTYITASLFHTVRGVFWLAEVSPAVSNWENCYHKVVDIQGDTEVEFMVPYVQQHFAKLGGGATYSIWFTILSWSQPDIALSAPIHLNVYKAGDSDFRFGALKDFALTLQSSPRQEFAKPFEPLHDKMTGYEQKGFLFGEEHTTMREMVHRYYNAAAVAGVTQSTLVWNPLVVGAATCGVEKFGAFFRFWRGSMRQKTLLPDASTATRAVGLTVNNEFVAGITASTPNNRIIEVEAPWYKNVLFEDVSQTEVPMSFVRSLTSTTVLNMKSAGDDFSFHFIRVPKCTITTPPVAQGVNGVIAFLI